MSEPKDKKQSKYKEWLANKRACEAQGKPGGVSAVGIPSCGDHDYESYKKFREFLEEREIRPVA